MRLKARKERRNSFIDLYRSARMMSSARSAAAGGEDHDEHQHNVDRAERARVERPGRQARLFADDTQGGLFEPVREKLFLPAFEKSLPDIESQPRHIRLRQNELALAYL